jgi:hypothetical protein
MGDGDEVEAVLHPVGPGSESVYDFWLADSLTVSYAGGAEEVRVYEVRVRPRDFERPGFVGTIYLDRATAAVVRMRFSFTAASYIDPYVDHIRIALDNSLWMGRFWLPYQQEIEIRREIPTLDLMLGSVIQGRFDVRGYDFNVELDDRVFAGRRVTAFYALAARNYRGDKTFLALGAAFFTLLGTSACIYFSSAVGNAEHRLPLAIILSTAILLPFAAFLYLTPWGRELGRDRTAGPATNAQQLDAAVAEID